MERTALQRLFAHKATRAVSSLEDFTTEALCVAVGRDAGPLVRALESVDDLVWAAARSGRPTIDLSDDVRAEADTQHYLYHEGLKGGRLDLVVRLVTRSGTSQTVWIEVKIGADLAYYDDRNQVEIYLDHRDLESPRPVVMTLAKWTPLVDGVVGITWAGLIEAVEGTPPVDPWWSYLVAFLRAEGAALPVVDEELVDEVMPVFKPVNRTIRSLWPGPPSFDWSSSWLGRIVRSSYRHRGNIWMTGGPLRYGLVQALDGWEWRVAVATGSDYARVYVDLADVLEAANSGGLPDTWERVADDGAVVQKRRPHVKGGPLGPVADWLSDSLGELERAKVLEPYVRAWRGKFEAEG